MFAFLLAFFFLVSIAFAALGHPKIYRLVFRKRKGCDTLDHKESFGI